MNCTDCGQPLATHAAACTTTRRAVVRGGKIIGWTTADTFPVATDPDVEALCKALVTVYCDCSVHPNETCAPCRAAEILRGEHTPTADPEERHDVAKR